MGEPEVLWLEGDHYGIAFHLPRILAMVRDHFLAGAPAPDSPAEPGADDFF